MKKYLLAVVITVFLFSCSKKEKADLLVYNATIYTVDSSFSTAEAMAVKDGKILAVGKTAELEKRAQVAASRKQRYDELLGKAMANRANGLEIGELAKEIYDSPQKVVEVQGIPPSSLNKWYKHRTNDKGTKITCCCTAFYSCIGNIGLRNISNIINRRTWRNSINFGRMPYCKYGHYSFGITVCRKRNPFSVR